ncbi:PLC-like phosphodiesterase [Amylostereum chailletii]|nr:PLC-like phosphodiesterase [Amylostereum chailletii]
MFTSVCGSLVMLPRATVCNGHAELCDRSYGNVTFAGSHDSFAFSKDPLALARDQEVDIPTQLGLGIRLLQAQAHLYVAFSRSERDARLIVREGTTGLSYLTLVATFLNDNPNEVITLIFTNPEGLSLPDVWAPAFEASGVSQFAYSEWPTLGQLIDSGKRVVVFLDAGADGSDGSVDYILPEFPMIWETPFSVTNSSFPCSVDRTAGPLSDTEHMYMINHSLNIDLFGNGDVVISDPGAAGTTNGITSIMANANGCAPLAGGRWPNFVLLDFVNIGEGVAVADMMNGF